MREGWEERPLSDLVERVTTRNGALIDRVFSVSAIDGLVDQEVYFTKRVASKNLTGYWVVEPGDYVFSKSASLGFPLGAVRKNLHSSAGVVSPIYIVMRRASDDIVDGWLDLAFESSLYAESLQGLLREGARAHGALNVKITEYLSARVPVPPLQQQRRIVDLVASLDAYIVEAKARVNAAQELRQAVLTKLLAPTGDASEWVETTLGEIAVWRSGSTPKATEARFYGGDIPFVAIGDLNDGVITRTAKRLTEAGLAVIGRLAPADAVFVSMYGTIGKVGIAASPMATNQAIAWAEANPSLVSNRFLLRWLQSHAKHFDDLGRGATQRNINREIIKKTEIRLPPLADQRRIVEVVDAVDEDAEAAAETVEAGESLRYTLLNELLSGKHDIPDTYDVLLDAAA